MEGLFPFPLQNILISTVCEKKVIYCGFNLNCFNYIWGWIFLYVVYIYSISANFLFYCDQFLFAVGFFCIDLWKLLYIKDFQSIYFKQKFLENIFFCHLLKWFFLTILNIYICFLCFISFFRKDFLFSSFKKEIPCLFL